MLNIAIPDNMQELTPKITVIGVGGAGGNAVNNMIESNLGCRICCCQYRWPSFSKFYCKKENTTWHQYYSRFGGRIST